MIQLRGVYTFSLAIDTEEMTKDEGHKPILLMNQIIVEIYGNRVYTFLLFL